MQGKTRGRGEGGLSTISLVSLGRLSQVSSSSPVVRLGREACLRARLELSTSLTSCRISHPLLSSLGRADESWPVDGTSPRRALLSSSHPKSTLPTSPLDVSHTLTAIKPDQDKADTSTDLLDGSEDRETEVLGSGLLGVHSSDHLGPVIERSLRVESSLQTGNKQGSKAMSADV